MKLNQVSAVSIPVPTYSWSDKAKDRLTVTGCAGAKAVALAVGSVPAVALGAVGGFGAMGVGLLQHPDKYASSILTPSARSINAGCFGGMYAGKLAYDLIDTHIWYKADNSRLRLSKDDECHRQKFENRTITHISGERYIVLGISMETPFNTGLY